MTLAQNQTSSTCSRVCCAHEFWVNPIDRNDFQTAASILYDIVNTVTEAPIKQPKPLLQSIKAMAASYKTALESINRNDIHTAPKHTMAYYAKLLKEDYDILENYIQYRYTIKDNVEDSQMFTDAISKVNGAYNADTYTEQEFKYKRALQDYQLAWPSMTSFGMHIKMPWVN